MAFEYQNYASLGINLNRQKYGPLDISSVFTNIADLNYYITKGALKENVSQYWLEVVPYPYEGQLISLIENGEVKVFKLVSDGEIFKTKEIAGDIELPDNLATKEYVENQFQEFETEYAPKMFYCVTQQVYDYMVDKGPINADTPYLIID